MFCSGILHSFGFSNVAFVLQAIEADHMILLPDIKMKAILFSVAQHLENRLRLSADKKMVLQANIASQPGQPKFWIFNPSYKRHLEGLLHYESKMSQGAIYTQVIVVRPNLAPGEDIQGHKVSDDEAGKEWDLYRQHYCNTHILLQLPKFIEVKDSSGVFVKKNVVEGSIGYARLIIQLTASSLGLEFAHIWDDNVIKCHRIDPKSIVESRSISAEGMRLSVPFDEVLKEIESVVRPNDLDCKELLEKADCSDDNKHFLDLTSEMAQKYNSIEGKTDIATSIEDYVSPASEIAIVGMRRDMPHLAAVRGKCPFSSIGFIFVALVLIPVSIIYSVEAISRYSLGVLGHPVEREENCG
jgi:hypothetical protein